MGLDQVRPFLALLLTLFLAPGLLVSSVSVVGSGNWGGQIVDTNNDACLGDFDMNGAPNFLSALHCSPKVALRFLNVSVPSGANVLATSNFSCYNYEGAFSAPVRVDDVGNSAPFTDLSQLQSRVWFSITMTSTDAYSTIFNVSDLIRHLVSRTDWNYGNNLTVQLDLGTTPYVCSMAPNSAAYLNITYQVQGNMNLQGPFNLVPRAGSWASGLNASSLSNLSVGIVGMTILNPFNFTTTQLNATNGFISNGQFKFPCLSLQLTSSGNKANVTCELPCAPGSGYQLTMQVCLALQNPLPIPLSPTSFCLNVTANGTITFPDPVLMPATLLPNDGRPYEAGAGLPNASASSQVLTNRSEFAVNMGVQHLCTTNLSQWASFQFGNFSLSCERSSVAPPPLATGDYSTVSCVVPACNASLCPELVRMFVTMKYLNASVMTTVDSLVYPTSLIMLAVSGCEDAPPTTINCPSSGGIWINITMSQTSGYTGVSVDVDGAPCTNVTVSSSQIYCLLPPGVGSSRPVIVRSGGYTSTTPLYISYVAPKITRLEGGLGCVPDDSFQNATGDGIYEADGSKYSAAVIMCDRNGSDSVPLTILGKNFGAANAPVSLKLRGSTINVTKDSFDPHNKMYFYLPPGPGSGARFALTLIVGLQIDSALVSYQPCPPGQDANCVACDVGRYGLDTPVCELCQKGRSQSQPGQSFCELCPKGTYQPALGQASCIPCPEQMTSTGVGSDSNKACTACPLTHYLDANTTECLRCAPNSVPLSASCGCLRGFFDDRETIVEGDGASLNCQPCPAGANCEQTGTRFMTMGPFAGWWRSGLGTFVQCLELVNCVGVGWGAFSPENASLMCVSHRSGVLCAECDQGYQPSSRRGGPCIPCDEDSSLAWVWASLVIVLLLIGLLSVGFYFYRKWLIRKLHAEMSSSAPSSPRHSPSNSLSGSASSPSATQQQPGLRQYGSVVPELVKSSARKARDTTSTIVSTSKILVGFLQVLSSMVTGNVSLPTAFMQVMQVFSFLNFDFMPWASIRCVFHIDFYSRIYMSCLYPFLIVALLLLCVGLPVALSNKRDFQDEETFRYIRSQFWTQTVTLALFCVSLLYPWVTLQLLQFGICLRVDDKYYLVADMTQLCLEGEWMTHLSYVIILFLLLSIGIPVTLGYLLYRSRGRLRTKQIRQRLGFLYLAYSSECWWFEIVEQATRVCLISIVRCFDPTLHALLRMVCCLAYIVAVLLLMPFVYHSLDRLSLFCMAEVMLVACLNHMLPVIGEWQGTFVDALLSALMLTLFFVFLLYTLFQIMRATRWLSHRPWAQKLLHKTPKPSDLQLGPMLTEVMPNQSTTDDESLKN